MKRAQGFQFLKWRSALGRRHFGKTGPLLILIPLAIGLDILSADPLAVFLMSSFAVIPLARLLGDATETIAHRLGPGAGGLLNATMGTVPDIIIGIFALRQGLIEVVKASITGAIVGNLLLGLGAAVILGGRKRPAGLDFDQRANHLHGGLLLLAVIGLVIPAIFDFSTVTEKEISFKVSLILFVTYIICAFFTLRHPEHESVGVPVPEASRPASSGAGMRSATLQLILVTVLLAIMSEILTRSVEPTAHLLGFTPIFTGIFLLAPLGGAVEIMNAVRFARSNNMDLALASTMGSAIQMALVAAPVLVLMGAVLDQPMNLLFNQFQVVAIIVAVGAVNKILDIGSVRWISGVKLIAIYVMLGIGFYYQP